MNDLKTLEQQRLALQSQLDSAKTQAERNRLGQFATPPPLASDIIRHTQSLLADNQPIRFLDPAFGTGAFFSAFLDVFAATRFESAIGFEVDTAYGLAAQQLWQDAALQLCIGDFTTATPPNTDSQKATVLICNPPYVRHHHLTTDQKQRLKSCIAQSLKINMNGLAGLYGYFLLLAHEWMANEGIAAWLVPAEFLDVNYGKAIKTYLLKNVSLLRVHGFSTQTTQFDDALVSSVVVWIQNISPSPDHQVQFTFGPDLTAPQQSIWKPINTLDAKEKWSTYFVGSSPATPYSQSGTLADLFRIKRGIATGANNFFILSAEDIIKHDLPSQFLTPILPSPRYLSSTIIEADEDGVPRLERQLWLLDCDLPEDEIKADFPNLWSYLLIGQSQAIHTRYLCRNRRLWYTQEKRPAAPLVCTYMGRREGNQSPFRVILNHSQATAPNVYLMLYPKPHIKQIWQHNPNLITDIWEALQKVHGDEFVRIGRRYGGGLYKLEPKELGALPLALIAEAIPNDVFENVLHQPMLW
jgi:hypothetical protein